MIPKISVIVTTFNSGKNIKKCLDSVLKTKKIDFEIIVVDDGSTDNTLSILNAYSKNKIVKLFSFRENKGPAVRRNFASKKVNSGIILFLDSDTLIKTDSLSSVTNKMTVEKEIGGLLMKLTLNDGSLDSAGIYMTLLGLPYETGAGENPHGYNRENYIFAAKTAGLAVRKKIFHKVGGFDEDYIIYGEDVDLSWRMQLAGYRFIYYPKAAGIHIRGGTLSESTRSRIFYEGAKNNLSNLLKNASLGLLIITVPLYLLSQFILSLKLFLAGKPGFALAPYKGILWNLINLRKTMLKRHRMVISKTRGQLEKYMFGEINILTLFRKGLRWYKNA